MRTIFLVVKGSPAEDVIKRYIAGHTLRNGEIIFLSKDELNSWINDVTAFELNEEKTGA